MKLQTKYFGELEIDEGEIIHFKHGIPGFPEDRNFVILSDPEDGSDFLHWLQSTDDGDVALVLIDVFQIIGDYDPQVNVEEMEELQPFEEEDLVVYNIAVIPQDIKKTTVNLKAPVVVNTAQNLGKQIIVNNEEYGIRHFLFDSQNENSEE